MSQYKNFTNYNTAAEEVRPSARIQLIQRILNAASIISSLVTGVPMKWASAYKSFQVLKYSENSDPEDVTSANAISAVDSILHEAESQIRSSNEDMETLVSELERMTTRGHLNYWDRTCDALKTNASIFYIGLVTPGAGTAQSRVIGVKMFLSPNAAPKGFCMSGTEWQMIPSEYPKIVADIANGLPSDTWITTSNVAGTTASFNQAIFALGADVETAETYGRQANLLQWSNANNTTYINIITGGTSFKVSIPWDSSTGDKDMTSPADSVDRGFTSTGLNMSCRVDPEDILGLPDPEDVISILNNM